VLGGSAPEQHRNAKFPWTIHAAIRWFRRARA
jgi:hypothetical protein